MVDLSEKCLDLLNGGNFEVRDPGPLHMPVYRLSIRRDENLRLIVTTEVPPNANSAWVMRPPGTVWISTEQVLLSNPSGIDAELSGVIPFELLSFYNGSVTTMCRESAQIHIAKTHNPRRNPVSYVIDWLENLPLKGLYWPTTSSECVVSAESREGITLDDRITIWKRDGRLRYTQNTAKLNVEGFTFYVCALHPEDRPGSIKPGCIIFVGNPNESFRRKVRTALSLALGRYLIYLGTTNYDGNWCIISTLAQSAYSMEKRFFDTPTELPAPMGPRFDGELSPARLTRAVGAFMRDFEKLDLANLSWAYWHACAATPHIAPVVFGAAIEALQNTYLKSCPDAIRTCTVDPAVWKNIRRNLATTIAGIEAPDEAKEAWKSKLDLLNRIDQRPRLRGLMEALGLELGEDEDAAWRRRNEAAHGTPVAEGEELAAIRDMKLLGGLFIRLLLRVTEAADQYFDRTTPNCPPRSLAEAPPNAPRTRAQHVRSFGRA